MSAGTIPAPLLARALAAAAPALAPPERIEPLAGGDIGLTARLRGPNADGVAKWYPGPRGAAMVEAEARGLDLLARADCGLVIPRVLSTATDEGGGLLLLEWLVVEAPTPRAARALGEGLARLHQALGEPYGLSHDNFLGATPQSNRSHESWPDFFATERLGALAERLVEEGRLRGARARALERLIARLPDLLPADPPPSLLHGDLWGGNWLAVARGRAALIDPAPYFGDREAELAMTHLFGGFSSPFYEAYEHAWPLPPGEPERRPIYQLYHLLNHLLLFGEGYGPGVDRVLARWK